MPAFVQLSAAPGSPIDVEAPVDETPVDAPQQQQQQQPDAMDAMDAADSDPTPPVAAETAVVDEPIQVEADEADEVKDAVRDDEMRDEAHNEVKEDVREDAREDAHEAMEDDAVQQQQQQQQETKEATKETTKETTKEEQRRRPKRAASVSNGSGTEAQAPPPQAKRKRSAAPAREKTDGEAKTSFRNMQGEVVWAKVERFPWWPAKVIDWKADEEMYIVDFYNSDDFYKLADDKRVLLRYPWDEGENKAAHERRWKNLAASQRSCLPLMVKLMTDASIDVPDFILEKFGPSASKKSSASSQRKAGKSTSGEASSSQRTVSSPTTPPPKRSSSKTAKTLPSPLSSRHTETSANASVLSDEDDELPSVSEALSMSPLKSSQRTTHTASSPVSPKTSGTPKKGAKKRNADDEPLRRKLDMSAVDDEPIDSVLDQSPDDIDMLVANLLPKGTKVLAEWKNGAYYPCKIVSYDKQKQKYEVEFYDDESKKWKTRKQIAHEQDPEFPKVKTHRNLLRLDAEHMGGLLSRHKDALVAIVNGSAPCERSKLFQDRQQRKTMSGENFVAYMTDDTATHLRAWLKQHFAESDEDYRDNVLFPEALKLLVMSRDNLESTDEAEKQIREQTNHWGPRLLALQQQKREQLAQGLDQR